MDRIQKRMPNEWALKEEEFYYYLILIITIIPIVRICKAPGREFNGPNDHEW